MAVLAKDVVLRRLADLGTNPFEAAESAGLQRNFIHDLVGRNPKKKTVAVKSLPSLAKALRWSVAELSEALDGNYPNEKRAHSGGRQTRTPAKGKTHSLVDQEALAVAESAILYVTAFFEIALSSDAIAVFAENAIRFHAEREAFSEPNRHDEHPQIQPKAEDRKA